MTTYDDTDDDNNKAELHIKNRIIFLEVTNKHFVQSFDHTTKHQLRDN